MVTITIPKRKERIKCPKEFRKLIFELNYKGYRTTSLIKWSDPLRIEIQSYTHSTALLVQGNKSLDPDMRNFYEFIRNNIEFEMKLKHPLDKEQFTLIMKIPLIKAYEMEKLFFNAHVKRR